MAEEDTRQNPEEGILQEENENKILPQIKAVIIISLTLLTCGACFAWPTLALLRLEDHLNPNQGLLIVIALPIGACVGPVLSALLLNQIGRKWLLYLTSIPFLVCWILTYLAKSWIELFVGRLVAGLSVGIIFTMVPVYLGEIVETKIRGAANTVMSSFHYLGFLIIYGIGPLLDEKMLALVALVPTIAFILTFMWIPESPYYYLKKQKDKQAGLALVWLRDTKETDKELNEIQVYVKEEESKPFMDVFKNRTYRKSLLIVLLLLTGQQLSGLLAVQSYAGILFKDISKNVNEQIVLLILGVLSLAGCLLSALVVDRIGRKPLYLISTYATALCLAGVGAYFLLEKIGMKVQAFSVAPMVAVALYFFILPIGIIPIPFVVSSEIFPLSVKNWTTMIANIYGSVLSIVVTTCYPIVVKKFDYHVIFLLFALFEVVVATVAAVVMPETSRKSFKEIEDMLKKDEKVRTAEENK